MRLAGENSGDSTSGMEQGGSNYTEDVRTRTGGGIGQIEWEWESDAVLVGSMYGADEVDKPKQEGQRDPAAAKPNPASSSSSSSQLSSW